MNRKFFAGLVVVALICGSTSLSAQQAMTAGSGSGAAGGSITIAASLDNSGGDAVAGWSSGLCNTAEFTPSTPTDTGLWDFNERAAFADGVTQGVVICFTGCNPIPGGTLGTEMYSVTYAVDAGAAPGDYPTTWCNSLGAPPVSTVVVVNGQSVPPTQNGGILTVLDIPDPEFNYEAPDAGPYNYPSVDGIGGMTFSVDYSISETDNSGAGAMFPNATQGFSMGLSHDDTLINTSSVASTGVLAGLLGGAGPDFLETNTYSNGFTVGCVYCFTGCATLDYASSEPVVSAGYTGVMGALMGVTGATTSSLTWDSGLGSPPVSNVVVVGGASNAANFSNGTITFNGTTTVAFETGDANGDGNIDVADIVWILQELFQGGTPSTCPIALDANGDGTTDIADAQYLANYIFLGGPAPADPFGTCATRMGQTPADCLSAGCTP